MIARRRPTTTLAGLIAASCAACAVCAADAPARAPASVGPPAPPPRVSVNRGGTDATPPAAVVAAYRALRGGDYATAAQLYRQLEHTEPRNLDVQLGLAAVAVHEGELEDARRRYLAVLQSEPAHPVARTALLAFFSPAGAAGLEAQLRAIASREPSAFVYQALGQIHARLAQWPQARHAWAQAHQLDPRHPDHAYNLAVSLEHVGEPQAAARHYALASRLARARPTSGFDEQAAAERARRLGGISP